MPNPKTVLITIVTMMTLMITITGCAPAADPLTTNSDETPAISGRITFAGSTTLQPLAAEIGDAFNQHYPDIELEIAAGGSRVGIQAVHNGEVDIGMASRNLHPDEEENIDQHQVAVDVIAVVVNTENSVSNLTSEDLQSIYLGEIENWSEVGGDDADITVVIRGANSGTRGAFDEIALDDQAPTAPNLQTAVTAGDMAAIVGDDANAIGYVGFGNIEPDIEVISIDDVIPSEETARDGSYRLTRPLLFLTGPLTQPLAQTFIDFALSDAGQQIVIDSGWVPVQ